MSASAPDRPVTPADIRAAKGGTPLVCLTAYTTPMARLVDRHPVVAVEQDHGGDADAALRRADGWSAIGRRKCAPRLPVERLDGFAAGEVQRAGGPRT